MDEDERLTLSDRLVVQVSRWDPLKDPIGVMMGFAEHVAPHVEDARLVLAGPSPEGVLDDPEGAIVLEQVRAARAGLAEFAGACTLRACRCRTAARTPRSSTPSSVTRRSWCRRASRRASG